MARALRLGNSLEVARAAGTSVCAQDSNMCDAGAVREDELTQALLTAAITTGISAGGKLALRGATGLTARLFASTSDDAAAAVADDVAGLADDFIETVGGDVATETGAWALGPAPRGLALEAELGGNLPRSFPTIDAFSKGTATSIKSIDLTASSYQSATGLGSRLTGYVDSVAGFNGASFSGRTITASQITGRELVIAVQPGAASSSQQVVLDQIVQYGADQGVVVRVVAIP